MATVDWEEQRRKAGSLRSRDLRRLATQTGWEWKRTKGSHHVYLKAGYRSLPIPETVKKRGTILGILDRLEKADV